MKRLFLSFFLLCFYIISFAQANVTSTAISVQGIARTDEITGHGIASTTLPITVTLYYLSNGTSGSPINILQRTGSINTDPFGVFTYVVSIDNTDFVKISNKEAWIKIVSGSTTFANEKLMVVPYSIHAQNGVPTGSIMPYIGTTAPAGWLLCDGSNIPTGDYYAALRKVLGDGTTDATKLPNLNGLFLRGTGNGTVNSVSLGGNTLKTIQDQQVGSHTHAQQGTITTSSNGSHNHQYYTYVGGSTSRSSDSGIGAIKADPEYTGGGSDDYPLSTTTAGSHTHTVTLTGSTASNSGTDTRPANYGVTYIIKI
jgi:microcystin-dependent protein